MTDNHKNGFAYTEAEKEAILDALPPGRRPVGRGDEDLFWRLIGNITDEIFHTHHETTAQQDRVLRTESQLASCETLLAAIESRQRDELIDRTVDPVDPLLALREQLVLARDGYRGAVIMEKRVLDDLRAKKSEPADMIIMKRAAKVWEGYDGKVGWSRAFDRFFEAVTAPKFRSDTARGLGLAYVANRKQRLIRELIPRPAKKTKLPKPLKYR